MSVTTMSKLQEALKFSMEDLAKKAALAETPEAASEAYLHMIAKAYTFDHYNAPGAQLVVQKQLRQLADTQLDDTLKQRMYELYGLDQEIQLPARRQGF